MTILLCWVLGHAWGAPMVTDYERRFAPWTAWDGRNGVMPIDVPAHDVVACRRCGATKERRLGWLHGRGSFVL